ncbi:molybdenum cofactor sulfurase, partial [Ochrobactrum sp. GRS2]|nr:molybdenum cofactor sulfurase [Ochrobactrum sp. GRS2]
MTRRAGGREPWYQRGTVIRNDRELSLISLEELEKIAAAMGLDAIRPEWIGANIVVEGIADFTLLPAGMVLFFDSGLTL